MPQFDSQERPNLDSSFNMSSASEISPKSTYTSTHSMAPSDGNPKEALASAFRSHLDIAVLKRGGEVSWLDDATRESTAQGWAKELSLKHNFTSGPASELKISSDLELARIHVHCTLPSGKLESYVQESHLRQVD